MTTALLLLLLLLTSTVPVFVAAAPCSIATDCNATNTISVNTSKNAVAGEPCGCVCKDGFSGPRCNDTAHSMDVNGQYRSQFMVDCASQFRTWDDAAAACAARSGPGWGLASIDSNATQTAVAALYDGYMWLGGSDAANESIWRWNAGRLNDAVFWRGTRSGTVCTTPPCACEAGRYCFWIATEPNGGTTENHLEIRSAATSTVRGWNDLSGSPAFRAFCSVCERSFCSIGADCNATNTIAVNSSKVWTGNGTMCGCVCKDGFSGPRCDDIAPVINVNDQYLSQYMVECASEIISWDTAAAACEAKGTGWGLASIDSNATQTTIAALYDGYMWLGGSDATSESIWRWQYGRLKDKVFWRGTRSGTVCSTPPCACEAGRYCRWAATEPSNSFSGTEHYLELRSAADYPTRIWNDVPILYIRNQCYACERSLCADVSQIQSPLTLAAARGLTRRLPFFPNCTATPSSTHTGPTPTLSASRPSTPSLSAPLSGSAPISPASDSWSGSHSRSLRHTATHSPPPSASGTPRGSMSASLPMSRTIGVSASAAPTATPLSSATASTAGSSPSVVAAATVSVPPPRTHSPTPPLPPPSAPPTAATTTELTTNATASSAAPSTTEPTTSTTAPSTTAGGGTPTAAPPTTTPTPTVTASTSTGSTTADPQTTSGSSSTPSFPAPTSADSTTCINPAPHSTSAVITLPVAGPATASSVVFPLPVGVSLTLLAPLTPVWVPTAGSSTLAAWFIANVAPQAACAADSGGAQLVCRLTMPQPADSTDAAATLEATVQTGACPAPALRLVLSIVRHRPDETASAALTTYIFAAGLAGSTAYALLAEPWAVEPLVLVGVLDGPCAPPAVQDTARFAIYALNPFAALSPAAAGAILVALAVLAAAANALAAALRKGNSGSIVGRALFPRVAFAVAVAALPGVAWAAAAAIRGGPSGSAIAAVLACAAYVVAVPSVGAAVVMRLAPARFAPRRVNSPDSLWQRLTWPSGRWTVDGSADVPAAMNVRGLTAGPRGELLFVGSSLLATSVFAIAVAPPASASCAVRHYVAAALFGIAAVLVAFIRPHSAPLTTGLTTLVLLCAGASTAAVGSAAVAPGASHAPSAGLATAAVVLSVARSAHAVLSAKRRIHPAAESEESHQEMALAATQEAL